MSLRILTSLLLVFLFVAPALADVECDGTDDDLDSANALSVFLSNATGTYALWYKPLGTANSSGGGSCAAGEFVFGDINASGYNTAIVRNGNLSGNDRLCVFNYDGTVDQVESAYTNTAWTHLVWVHTGGNLLFYKDGALVSSVASGNTNEVTRTIRLCNGGIGGVANGEGIIAAPHTFSTALSANEIATLAGSRLHRIAISAPSGAWELSGCADGASCDTQTFGDRSGLGHPLTAAGGTGRASEYLSYPWGVE